METVDSRCEMELTASTSGTYFPRDFMVSLDKIFILFVSKVFGYLLKFSRFKSYQNGTF